MTPRRIQLRRVKGWRKPEGAVVVARPSRWGNPYRVSQMDGLPDFYHVEAPGYGGGTRGLREARELAVTKYRQLLRDIDRGVAHPTPEHPLGTYADIRRELAGRDLACWCPLVDAGGNPVPCHADVLLSLANSGGAS